MSKHTPGPWMVSETDTSRISVRPEVPFFPGEDAPQGWGVCSLQGPEKIYSEEWSFSGKTSRHEFDKRGRAIYEANKANARLIAAAPEMLEACEAAKAYHDAIIRKAVNGEYELAARGAIAQGIDLDSLFDDWMNKTALALAKARGES